jgi:hypothetical protein
MSSIESADFLHLANSLQKRGLKFEEILLQLKEKGVPENLLQDILQQLKNLRLTRKRKTGFVCCGIGVALLVIGCMFTIFLFNSGGSIRFVMYGLTTAGVVFTIKGLVDLMGW